LNKGIYTVRVVKRGRGERSLGNRFSKKERNDKKEKEKAKRTFNISASRPKALYILS
jgi:hypothetical protein